MVDTSIKMSATYYPVFHVNVDHNVHNLLDVAHWKLTLHSFYHEWSSNLKKHKLTIRVSYKFRETNMNNVSD